MDTFCGNFWWTFFVSTFFVDTFSWHFFFGNLLWTLFVITFFFNTYLSFWLMPQARLIWSAPYRWGALLSRPTTVWNLIPTVWHWWLPTETTWTQPLPRSFYQVSAGQKLSTDCWWWYIILRLSRPHVPHLIGFSLNRPTGPIRSSSRDVRVLFFVCLSPFHALDFEAYFDPTSRSQISKMFRDSEFLGENAGKKWSKDWTFL